VLLQQARTTPIAFVSWRSAFRLHRDYEKAAELFNTRDDYLRRAAIWIADQLE
jgi:hypothetical protein